MIKYQPITDTDCPIVDFGETWSRIDLKTGERLFEISKKDNPEWLRAFLLKWIQDENFTEYGEKYYNDFYHKDLIK